MCRIESQPNEKRRLRRFKRNRSVGLALISIAVFNLSLMQIGRAAEADGWSFATMYVNKYFEVREHDALTKYVFTCCELF